MGTAHQKAGIPFDNFLPCLFIDTGGRGGSALVQRGLDGRLRKGRVRPPPKNERTAKGGAQ